MSQHGRIVGVVTYSVGDGPDQTIPPGPCTIEATGQDVMISWDDQGTGAMAVIPRDHYTMYLTAGAITVQR